jgi:hypothetical protein
LLVRPLRPRTDADAGRWSGRPGFDAAALGRSTLAATYRTTTLVAECGSEITARFAERIVISQPRRGAPIIELSRPEIFLQNN